MQQGRRTASLKASYEAINTGVHAHEFSIGKELAGAAQTAIAAIQETTKKQKKYVIHITNGLHFWVGREMYASAVIKNQPKILEIFK
jgi:hypothetical protein